MIVTFEETYLQELYEIGTINDKKHRYQPDIVKRYQKCVQLMKSVPDVVSLAKYNSLNYETLKVGCSILCAHFAKERNEMENLGLNTETRRHRVFYF